MRCYRYHLTGAGLAAWCLMTAAARADVAINFESPPYNASAAGTLLTGQQGWYVPVAGSAEYSAFTYAGNALSIPANPTGGSQFVGAVNGGGTVFARAQQDTSFAGINVWTFSYDVAHRYNGTLPTAQNLGSFSMANTATTTFRQLIALHTWADINTGANWNAGFVVFNADGTPITGAGLPTSPGAPWNNLAVDNWYRESFTVDFSTNSVVSVSITDITTGITNTTSPAGWFMLGGAAGITTPLPTSVRFFAGGNPVGNVAAWDNLSVVGVPEPSSVMLVGAGVVGLLGRRYRRRRESAEVAG